MTAQTPLKAGARRAAPAERRDTHYRQLRIVAGALGGTHKAIAYAVGKKLLRENLRCAIDAQGL